MYVYCEHKTLATVNISLNTISYSPVVQPKSGSRVKSQSRAAKKQNTTGRLYMLSLIPTMATFAALIIWNVSIRWWPIYPGVKVDIDVINNDFHAEFTLLDIQISARVKPYRTHNTGNLFIWPCGLPAMPCCVQVCRKR